MTTDELAEFYINLKRIFYNKPFLRTPNNDSVAYHNLERLRIHLGENNISPDEFILVNVRAYGYKKSFPQITQLLGTKSLNRYNEYARKKYTKGQLFRLDRTSACILATGAYYSIEEFLRPFEKDPRVVLVWTFAKEGKIEFEQGKFDKVWEYYQYTLAKYEFARRTPPNSLLEWGAELKERRKQEDNDQT